MADRSTDYQWAAFSWLCDRHSSDEMGELLHVDPEVVLRWHREGAMPKLTNPQSHALLGVYRDEAEVERQRRVKLARSV